MLDLKPKNLCITLLGNYFIFNGGWYPLRKLRSVLETEESLVCGQEFTEDDWQRLQQTLELNADKFGKNEKDWKAVAQLLADTDNCDTPHDYALLKVLMLEKKELKFLAEHGSEWCRCCIASEGFYLSYLINDSSGSVRREVAKHGFGLDKLVKDPCSAVRLAVAEQGYGLDKLMHDTSGEIRKCVVHHQHRLEDMIKDKSYAVRREVARQGFGLDKLINDQNKLVRKTAEEMLKKQTS